MADNNVIRFRRIQKKPGKRPEPPRGAAPNGPRMPASRLSLIAWGLIVAVAAVIAFLQQSGLLGG